MKKVLSIFLAVLVILAMIPSVFAASAPAITATASKTSVVAGDTVKLTVKAPANSNLVSFQYIVNYSTSYFQVVDGSLTLGGNFGYEDAGTDTPGTIKYAAATGSKLTKATTLFTVEFKIVKPGGKITFTVDEAYVDDNGVDTDVTAACQSASTKSITFKSGAATPSDYFAIQSPSTTTIKHKCGIVLHLNQKATKPASAHYEWTADNSNFKMEVSSDGTTCTIISDKNGDTTFTVKLIGSTGSVLDTETITMTSKAGFFDKIVSFFRGIFGGNKVADR